MNELAASSEVYRGHFEECLQHLAKVIRGFNSQKKVTAYKALADFCGVTPATARSWFVTKSRPNGIAEIKFNCVLDLAGYRVIELENIKRTLRNFYELMGFSVISPDEVKVYLHYSTNGRVYSIFAQGNPEEKRRKLMWDKWKEKKDELEQKKVKNKKLAEKLLQNVAIMPTPSINQRALNMMVSLLKLLDNGAFSTVSKKGITEASANQIIRLTVHLAKISELIVVPEKKGGG